MAFTPAHGAKVRGQNRSGLLGAHDLIRVRKLYLERRYKQCIAACDENQGTDLHPIHKAFLFFQQAISYEALGIAAHSYSRNKIPFLVSAEDKFGESLDALPPQPFTTYENGRSPTPTPSPLVTTFAASGPSPNEALTLDTPTSVINEPTESPFPDSSSEYSSQSPSAYSIPSSGLDFDRYSARSDLLAIPRGIPRTTTFPDVDKQDEIEESEQEDDDVETTTVSNGRESKPMSRLSSSLSSNHVIADALVPSPLFSRNKKTVTMPFPPLDVTGERICPTKSHPLPPALYGNVNDHSLFPIRKTATSTLISRFQTILPSPNTPYSIYTDAPIPSSAAGTTVDLTTPVTLRFNLIRSIFTPTSITPHLAAYPSSCNLAHYNAALASFRASIVCAIATTADTIASASEIQDQHAQEKRRMFLAPSKDAGKRLASYWLLSTPTPHPGSTVRAAEERSDRGAGSDRRRTSGGLRSRTLGRWKGIRQQDEEDNAVQKKIKERIENLRADGFRVRKEKFGWKGMEYYEELRRNAERDLDHECVRKTLFTGGYRQIVLSDA